MRIDCSSEFKRLGRIAQRMVGSNGNAANMLRDATLQIGRANDPHYGVPASAVTNPIFVGDHAAIGAKVGLTPELEALYKKNAMNVDIRPRFNARSGKYDMVFQKSGIQQYTGDSGELIAAQAISPWNASFFPELFHLGKRQVLPPLCGQDLSIDVLQYHRIGDLLYRSELRLHGGLNLLPEGFIVCHRKVHAGQRRQRDHSQDLPHPLAGSGREAAAGMRSAR